MTDTPATTAEPLVLRPKWRSVVILPSGFEATLAAGSEDEVVRRRERIRDGVWRIDRRMCGRWTEGDPTLPDPRQTNGPRPVFGLEWRLWVTSRYRDDPIPVPFDSMAAAEEWGWLLPCLIRVVQYRISEPWAPGVVMRTRTIVEAVEADPGADDGKGRN